MDPREIVLKHPEMIVGHHPVEESLNLQKEIRRFTSDPMSPLIETINDSKAEFLHGDVGRYRQALTWYILCLKRALIHISVARRHDAELRYHPKNKSYSERQRKIADNYNQISPFLELDYQNLIIHSCILLDRVVTLSRRFISGAKLPSFTSFIKHKNFLIKNTEDLNYDYSEYVKFITQETQWFDVPLKVLRDKYLMHSSEMHMSSFGWRNLNRWDLEMLTIIFVPIDEETPAKVKAIVFTPRRLARDIKTFLVWYSQYGVAKLNE